MPRNGSGTYSLPPGINPVVTQTLITSNWANTTMNDLAAAITGSLARDGQSLPTANIPMGGFRLTGLGDPVLRDQAATLGYVQDGKHTRLTGVGGVNQIVATLPGGTTALTVGQIVQLVPSSNNTGAVTLDINSIGPKPVVTEIGTALAGGNLVAGRPYLLSYTGAQFVIIAGGGGSSIFAQSAMSGWDRPTITGPYPVLTIVNPTTIAVPAGKGRIIKPSTRDLSGVTEVSWPAQNVTISNVAVTWTTVLGVDINGNIVQFTGGLSSAWARENILLGTVSHINGVINGVITRPAIFGDMTYGAYDLTVLFHNSLIAGGRLSPNAVNALHVDITAGSLFSLGANSPEVNSPNIVNFPTQLDISFFPITGTSGVSALTQNVPVTNYDPTGAGVITPIGGGATQTSIHRMYFLAGQFLFQYGQSTYADLTTALNQIGVDSSSNKPAAKLANATLLGYLVIQKNCLDLKDTGTCRLVAQGGFGFSIGSAGSISDAPINGLTYGRKDAAWVEVVNAPKGPQATLRMITAYTGTFARFSWGLNDTPEAGSNSGSDFELRAFNDAGTLTGTAFRVNRATRQTTLFADATVETPASPTLYVNATGNAANLHKGSMSIGAGGSLLLQTNNDDNTVSSYARMLKTGGIEVALGTAITLPFFSISPTKVFADYNNANVNLRHVFQPNAAGGTSVGCMPGSGGTAASWTAWGSNSDLNNSHGASFGTSGTATFINSIRTGTGIAKYISFQIEGVEKASMALDGTLTSIAKVAVSGAASTNRLFSSQTNGSIRWEWGADSTAESGSNAGSNWSLIKFNDAGVPNGNAMKVFRSDGHTEFNNYIDLKGPLAGAQFMGRTSQAAEAAIYCDTGSLRLNVAGTDRLSIDSSGNTSMGASLSVVGNVTSISGNVVSSAGTFSGAASSVVLGNASGAGTVFLRPNGIGSATGQMTVSSTGLVQGTNFQATSDARLKKDIAPKAVRGRLADLLEFVSYLWKETDAEGLGLIAQQVQKVAPEYVHEGPDGVLGIDKASLAIECVIGLAARVRELEERL